MADTVPRDTSWWHFSRHFVEMIVGMALGMVILGMIDKWLLEQLGYAAVLDQTELNVLLMTINMSLGMLLPMLYRGHGWASIGEMTAAMFVPFIVLIVLFWSGMLSENAMFVGGHVLMLPCMIIVMLRRRDEYSSDHRMHQSRSQDIAAVPTQDPGH